MRTSGGAQRFYASRLGFGCCGKAEPGFGAQDSTASPASADGCDGTELFRSGRQLRQRPGAEQWTRYGRRYAVGDWKRSLGRGLRATTWPTRGRSLGAFRGPSRSRYLSFPETLRDVVGNAYLLCRITDCIEDEPALTPREKQRFANRFVGVVEGREDSATIGPELAAALSSSTPRGERDLVANTARVIRIARRFREEQRRAVARCVRIMASGMSDFQQLDTSAGLKDLRQLNRYCYVVAGVVGEMLTELFCDYIERDR